MNRANSDGKASVGISRDIRDHRLKRNYPSLLQILKLEAFEATWFFHPRWRFCSYRHTICYKLSSHFFPSNLPSSPLIEISIERSRCMGDLTHSGWPFNYRIRFEGRKFWRTAPFQVSPAIIASVTRATGKAEGKQLFRFDPSKGEGVKLSGGIVIGAVGIPILALASCIHWSLESVPSVAWWIIVCSRVESRVELVLSYNWMTLYIRVAASCSQVHEWSSWSWRVGSKG